LENQIVLPEPGINGTNGWRILSRRGPRVDDEAQSRAMVKAVGSGSPGDGDPRQSPPENHRCARDAACSVRQPGPLAAQRSPNRPG